ncbi:MAG: hypothetical protein H7257_09570 [Taibaiella sp.]|nr:hypothetical protein [Taibaiella sp.]
MQGISPLIDMTYIHDIAGTDPVYIYEITGIFIDTMSVGIPKLGKLIEDESEFDKIHAQAHYLKSSAGIIKLRDNYESLIKIDKLAQQNENREEIKNLFNLLWANFQEALPELLAVREKNKVFF